MPLCLTCAYICIALDNFGYMLPELAPHLRIGLRLQDRVAEMWHRNATWYDTARARLYGRHVSKHLFLQLLKHPLSMRRYHMLTDP